jgi:hypothetical protein
MLDPIQYEFLFLFTTLADPEPEPGAGPETSIFQLWLQAKVPASCGSGSTTLHLSAGASQTSELTYQREHHRSLGLLISRSITDL